MFYKFLYIIFFFLTHLLYSNTAFSEVYKWVDDDGKVVYGDKPTADNAEKIKIQNAPKKNQHDLKRIEKQQKLLNIIQEERDEKISLKKEDKEKKDQQKLKCAETIKALQETKDASFLYEKTDDPDNPKYLSDEERKIEEEKYEKYIKKNC